MMPSHHASASTSAGIWTGSLTDLRHAFRLLWKSKGITATTLVTLALWHRRDDGDLLHRSIR